MKKKPKAPNDPTITDRDRRYRENRKRDGFVQVHVFVPMESAQKVRDLARRLRKQHAKQ